MATDPATAPTLYRLPGVNLFASGTYRGRPYPVEYLDGVAATCKRLGSGKLLTPPAVLGHEENQEWLGRTDLPAAGWVDPATVRVVRYYEPATKRVEGVLRGDVVNMPPAAADLVRQQKYATCSIEFYEFSDDFGRSHGQTIRRLALLGGEVPQVKRLGRLPDPVPMAAPVKFAERPPPRLSLLWLKAGPRSTAFCFAETTPMTDRASLIAQLVAAGQDEAMLQTKTDAELQEMAAALGGQAPAVPMADAPATTRDAMIAQLVAAGQDATLLAGKTDDELRAMLAAAPVAAMSDPKKAADCMGEVQKILARARADAAEITRMAEAQATDLKAGLVEEVCGTLARRGVPAAFVDAFVRPGLLAADHANKAVKFSEGGQSRTGTLLQAKAALAKVVPLVVKMGERVAGGPAGSDPAAAKARVIEAAARFAEDKRPLLLNAGYKTPAAFVAKFAERYEQNPEAALAELPPQYRTAG